ncbi:MAG: serine/threonine protein kinase [Azoarcus sp.]|jgi:serine/threonine protein kinase|nr:serine/threonine protein kinase [Azoarcus sp.]
MSNEQRNEPIVPVNALPVGTKLAEYVIRSVIGEGGFGIVYLADDTFLGREVAIKEYLPGSLAGRGAALQVEVRQDDKRELFMKGLRRFVNEAHLLARFRHPALLSVLRYIETNGTAYMVMPYYRGKTLREMVRNGFRAKTTEDLFSFLLPVLDGLAQMHSVECYHLDISSDNIMVLENGAPVLLDFGAARHTELAGRESTTIILKPGFAPIEQYGSDDSELVLGPWTDIYAISAVAYLLVSGAMPPVSVARIMKDTLVSAVNCATPDLPAGILKVIDAGLALKPQERPQSVAVLREALLEGADGFVPPVLEEEASPSFPGNVPSVKGSHGMSRGSSPVARWGVLFVVLLMFAATVILSGCKSLFDSPPGTENVHQEAALKTMNKLVSPPEDVVNKATEYGKAKTGAATDAARQHAADVMEKARPGFSSSGDELEEDAEWETPNLSFERVNADMPHLAIWGLDDATLLVDGEEIEPGKMTRAGRIALLSTGRHQLQVKCPFDPPFSADFYLVKGDRGVLRGRCSSGGRTVAGEKKRN